MKKRSRHGLIPPKIIIFASCLMWTDVPEARLTCTTQNRKVKSTDVKLLDFCKHDKTTLKVNGKTNMLKTKIISLSLLLLSTCIATQAQKRKKTKGKAVKTEMTEEQERVEAMRERMLPSTAQVMFIDSVVTDKAGFISKIPLNSESGEIGTTGEAADTAASIPGGTYVNEFGNKRFYAKADTSGHYRLYTADKLGGKWTGERLIDEFGDEFEDINFPYMMADGVTLYFAAKGKEGLGGYDIYMTRYDRETGRFYEPENAGLPYNSTGNDYYCVIDEFDNIGWLVTDRRQPNGKVCIYTFVPAETRTAYDIEAVGESKVESLADIRSISDTWTDDAKLQAARTRLKAMTARKSDAGRSQMAFVVNDRTVYTSAADFKSPTNRQRFTKLCNMKDNAAELAESLDDMRLEYAKSSSASKRQLGASILKAERQFETLEANIKKLEKEIRNTENMMGGK